MASERDAIRNEIQVGRGLAARLARQYGVLRAENATAELTMLGRKLASESARPELRFIFGILDTDEVNAYSCPGGYILFTRGALISLQTDGELAFVIAHEIAHVALQHSGRFDQSSGWMDFVAGLIGGGMNVVNTMVRTTTDQLEETLLKNGREQGMEFTADEAGLILAVSAGYGSSDALAYLRRLEMQTGTQQARTHPPAAARRSRLQAFAAEQGIMAYGQGGNVLQQIQTEIRK